MLSCCSSPAVAPPAPRVAIVYYSMYGHVRTMAQAVARGIRAGGCAVTLYQVPETLTEDGASSRARRGSRSDW